jgi:hypothetical protein
MNARVRLSLTSLCFFLFLQSKASVNSTVARRIKKSLYGGDLHSSNILLFSSKNAMVKERVTLASDLWTDNLPCLYLHPSHLTHSNLRLYAKEYMIRWLVLFKKAEFREKSQVQVIDLAASTNKSAEKSTNAQENMFMSVNEVSSFIRTRLLGKQAETSIAGSGHASSSSHSSFSGHAHAPSHTKPMWHVHIIDSQNIKASVKTQVLTQAKRCLNNVVAAANPASFGVAAVDLPFALIRSLTTAFYQGAAQVQAALEESHAKQRVICDQLIAYMMKKCGSAHIDAHPPTSAKLTQKEKQQAALAAAAHEATRAERVEVLYIYSIPDKKADMVLTSS